MKKNVVDRVGKKSQEQYKPQNKLLDSPIIAILSHLGLAHIYITIRIALYCLRVYCFLLGSDLIKNSRYILFISVVQYLES